MTDDLNKNIIIQVTAQTSQLEQSITNLNKIIDSLQAKQQQLAASGDQTSASFQNNADKIDIFQKSLQNASAQLNTFQSALDNAAGSLQKNQSLISALTAAKDKYSKTVGDSSKKVTDLNAAIKTLSASAQQQQAQTAKSSAAIDANTKSLAGNAQQATNIQSGIDGVNTSLNQQKQAVDNNKSSFDAHKAVMDHLKTSFDEIKDVSGEFGPSLQDAAQGFNMMKSGLAVVKDGLNGVGDAMKADGFDFLLIILQQLFNAFINSSEGTKVLQGAISAIGVVVNKVKTVFHELLGGIINAVTHPIDSIKALGRMVEQNIINRFTAFSKILDGLIHLDFKKVADGAIQAVTGVTDATGKIASAVQTVTGEIVNTGKQIGDAYTDGFNTANQAVNDHEQKVKASTDREIRYYNNVQKARSSSQRGPDIDNNFVHGIAVSSNSITNNQETIPPLKIATAAATDTKKAENIYKKAFEQIEADAKKSAVKIADDAINALENSIKQQSEARVQALESQKNAELNNSSLTGAQRIAIEAKFKKQQDQVKAKAFKQEQELNIAKTLMAAAQAEIKLWVDPAFPGAIAETVILAALTANQIAKIETQKPPAYATGGLHYTSDGRGGVLSGYSRTDNTNAYLRSGEGIVVSEAMRAPWARNLVSAINVGFGGKDFSTTHTGRGYAVGGVFTDGGDANRYYNAPVNDQKNLANTIAYQMVNNFPPVYVDVKDINNQQNILAQTINRVNL
jgi:hypothetical protein